MARKYAVDPNIDPLKKVQTNGSLVNIGDVNDPNLSESYKDRAAAAYQNAVDQYNQGSFASRHPILSNVGAAVIGGALAGPAGLIAGPSMVNRIEDRRKHDIMSAYNEYMKTLGSTEKDLNQPRIDMAIGNGMSTALKNEGYESPLPANTPMSHEGAKLFLNGGVANHQLNEGLDTQNGQIMRTVKTLSPLMNKLLVQPKPGTTTQPPAPTKPGEPDPVPPLAPGQPYLAASASDAPPAEPAPLQPYLYRNPELTQHVLDNSAGIQKEIAHDLPDYAQMPAKIALLVKQGKVQDALALLHQAQTVTEKGRPALIQSEIVRNLRPPTAPQPNAISLMTPEQRKQYAANIAAGNQHQHQMTPAEAKTSLELLLYSGLKPDSPEFQAAAANYFRQIGSGGFNPGFQSPPAGAPMPGAHPSGAPGRPGALGFQGLLNAAMGRPPQ